VHWFPSSSCKPFIRFISSFVVVPHTHIHTHLLSVRPHLTTYSLPRHQHYYLPSTAILASTSSLFYCHFYFISSLSSYSLLSHHLGSNRTFSYVGIWTTTPTSSDTYSVTENRSSCRAQQSVCLVSVLETSVFAKDILCVLVEECFACSTLVRRQFPMFHCHNIIVLDLFLFPLVYLRFHMSAESLYLSCSMCIHRFISLMCSVTCVNGQTPPRRPA